MAGEYCIKWNDFNSHLGFFFANLYSSEQHADVTLKAEGASFKCHKIVLSASSPYFDELLASTVSKHPIIILAGVKADDIKTIIDFMYHGEMKNISYECFISVLKTAEMLKINGLTEVTIFQSDNQSLEESAPTSELSVPTFANDNTNSIIQEVTVKTEDTKYLPSDNCNEKLEDSSKFKDCKKQSENNIDRALKDMEWGMSLMEASRIHKIPRSTLYAKAKHHSGLHIVSRKEHSNQDCHQALLAIADGMSLKRAAEEFSIPKTVLWRRVQKRLDILSKVKCRKKKGNKHLRNFMDSDDGFRQNEVNKEIHSESTGDEDIEDESRKSLKNIRLSQAVEACKTGKMSQAAASTTFQVPKTTIWRRLQKCSKQDAIKPQIVIEKDHKYTLPSECGEFDSQGDKCSRTNKDNFKSSALIVKPVLIFSPGRSNHDCINNFENCVEIRSEEEDECPIWQNAE